MEYRLRWEIDIEADDPVAAARAAHEIMLDPASFPPVFTVHAPDGTQVAEVDLYEENKDPLLARELPTGDQDAGSG